MEKGLSQEKGYKRRKYSTADTAVKKGTKSGHDCASLLRHMHSESHPNSTHICLTGVGGSAEEANNQD